MVGAVGLNQHGDKAAQVILGYRLTEEAATTERPARPALYEHAAVRRAISHRQPALLVERVLELEPFERIVTTKTVSGSEPCYPCSTTCR
ncbi:hypothetical protein [Streptomyces sp. NPDC085540]|uniref:hypothetical protein n=1 Tax=Streptomyces sp. NPDC085540 TaxID=3365730 RepID=UPI0037D034C2